MPQMASRSAIMVKFENFMSIEQKARPTRTRRGMIDVDQYLLKAQNQDLLAVDPRQLSLKDKLKRKRQEELAQEQAINPVARAISTIVQDHTDEIVDTARSHHRKQVFEMSMTGMGNQEIADALGIKISRVSHLLMLTREYFKTNHFEPEGIKLVKSFGEKYSSAARDGKLVAEMFLGMYYTTEGHIRSYENAHGRNYTDQRLAHQGYVRLRSCVSANEHRTIQQSEKYQKYLKYDGRVLYIKPEDIEKCQSIRRKRTEPDAPPANENYIALGEFVSPELSRKALRMALKSGKLKGVFTKKGWFVKAEDFKDYMINYRTPKNHLPVHDFYTSK